MNAGKNCTRWMCVSIAMMVAAWGSVHAQLVQQGAKLVGTGAVPGSVFQGTAVAISADGNTAVVGGNYDDGTAGGAWIYARTNCVWSQEGSKLVGSGASGNALQGQSVAISGDGSTVIVGAPYDDNNKGAAWIFVRGAAGWTQQGGKLVGTGIAGPDAYQGQSVALSEDGSTALVGGPTDNNEIGAIWVFTRSGGVWSQQGSKLVGSGGVGTSWQGQSVALSADGNTAVAGGLYDDGGNGAAWFFQRSGTTWSQMGDKRVGTGGVGAAEQGTSVALSDDGSTALVGGPKDDGGIGATWVFVRAGGSWSQQARLVGAGGVGNANQGTAAGLSANGDIGLVGGSQDDSQAGAAWMFVRSGTSWFPIGGKLSGTGSVGAAGQGWSGALSDDGGTALIGGPFDDGGAGAVWAFSRACPDIEIVWPCPVILFKDKPTVFSSRIHNLPPGVTPAHTWTVTSPVTIDSAGPHLSSVTVTYPLPGPPASNFLGPSATTLCLEVVLGADTFKECQTAIFRARGTVSDLQWAVANLSCPRFRIEIPRKFPNWPVDRWRASPAYSERALEELETLSKRLARAIDTFRRTRPGNAPRKPSRPVKPGTTSSKE